MGRVLEYRDNLLERIASSMRVSLPEARHNTDKIAASYHIYLNFGSEQVAREKIIRDSIRNFGVEVDDKILNMVLNYHGVPHSYFASVDRDVQPAKLEEIAMRSSGRRFIPKAAVALLATTIYLFNPFNTYLGITGQTAQTSPAQSGQVQGATTSSQQSSIQPASPGSYKPDWEHETKGIRDFREKKKPYKELNPQEQMWFAVQNPKIEYETRGNNLIAKVTVVHTYKGPQAEELKGSAKIGGKWYLGLTPNKVNELLVPDGQQHQITQWGIYFPLTKDSTTVVKYQGSVNTEKKQKRKAPEKIEVQKVEEPKEEAKIPTPEDLGIRVIKAQDLANPDVVR